MNASLQEEYERAESLFENGFEVEALALADDLILPLLGKANLVAQCHVRSLLHLGDHLSSKKYYGKAVSAAKRNLSAQNQISSGNQERIKAQRKVLEDFIDYARSRMDSAAAGTLGGDLGDQLEESEPKPWVNWEMEEELETRNKALADTVRPYWVGLSAERKKAVMKMNIKEFKSFVEELYGREGREALERGLKFAQESRRWKLWICRLCSNEFLRPAELKKHLEQYHVLRFRLSPNYVVPQKLVAVKVDKVWAGKVTVGEWKPVDTVAAVRMISDNLADVKEFAYRDGWSKDWPSVDDEVRRNLLEGIQKILQLLVDLKILSSSVREWLVNFVAKHLRVSLSFLEECGLDSTPQCLCFLGLHELDEVFRYLGCFRLKPVDGTDLISQAINHAKELDDLWGRSRVKERINFDDKFSCLLLDKRLLTGKIKTFDDEGTVGVVDSSTDPYTGVSPQGDEIVHWLCDCPLQDHCYDFRQPIRKYNLQIRSAIGRAIYSQHRTLAKKHQKKSQLQLYEATLRMAEKLCVDEDERRDNIPENQWKSYASILCDKCREIGYGRISAGQACFLSVVVDILEQSSRPTLRFIIADMINRISKHPNVEDRVVLMSISMLQKVVLEEIPLGDSKILLVIVSMKKLLDGLIELSAFDYRFDIIPLMKFFLHKTLKETISAEAAANLLKEIDEENKQALLQERKTKNNKLSRKEEVDKKGTSTQISSPMDQIVEPEASVIPEPDTASTLVKMEKDKHAEHASLEDKLSSEREPFRVSENRKETELRDESSENRGIHLKSDFRTKDEELSTQLVSAPLENAMRYDLFLDIMLKALWHIKAFREETQRCRQPVHNHNHQEKRHVLCALQNLFSSFVTEQMNDKNLHRFLLNELIVALEDSQSMETDAAELLMSVLEFLHYWKSPSHGESLATFLFTQEEFERMSCNRCRRETNYKKQRSYGLKICAESIREFKSAFGYMKFEDILKAIRMNFQMYCDTKTGGCGKRNYVCHDITKCPAIFIIELKWEKIEAGEEISEMAKALDTEIDISMLYKGVNLMTNYRLVSMIGCKGEEEYSCIAYENNRWGVTHDPLVKEEIGDWNSVVRFCTEREVRPQILFFEATWLPKKP
ncbi:PREDICTED: uncharacterized protein LOC104821865 isoform X2 [Tarenaya hassleriana]|uniref:uncharacterized protein LOC104821865 isoform X2 n=1 Tax=Tarenaya hassleriana TaxID=28532 RepID=UPI00053C83F5|nr:PREDICTED: uncharacterized protein LOC104821865 isoform X2 [Tarenaya hassleriana]